MIPRTRGSGRTARRLLLLAAGFAAGLAAQRAVTPVRPDDVHLSGDGSAQLAEQLFEWPGPPRAADPATAATQVVTLRRWQNLEGLPDLARLCGAACDGRAGVVTILRPSPGGMTRIVLVDLGDHGAGEQLDGGAPMTAPVVACALRSIDRARLGRPADDGAECPEQTHARILRPRLRRPQPA